MARSEMSCSIGWCVGPSSPRPMESCVIDEDDGDVHQRRQPHRRLHVVGEDEERRAVRAQLRQRHAVRRSRPWRARECRSGSCGRRSCRARNRLSSLDERLGRRIKIGRRRRGATAHVLLPRSAPAESDFAAWLCLWRRQGRWGCPCPSPPAASRSACAATSSSRSGILASTMARNGRSSRSPSAAPRSTAFPMYAFTSSGTRNCASGGQPYDFLGQPHFVLAQRFAVRFLGVLTVRRAPTDMECRR